MIAGKSVSNRSKEEEAANIPGGTSDSVVVDHRKVVWSQGDVLVDQGDEDCVDNLRLIRVDNSFGNVS